VPERQDEDRRRVGVGRRDAREGVLGARPVLHGEDAVPPAVRDPAEPVRDVNADALLAAEDRTDADGGARLDQDRRRVAAQEVDALSLEDLGDGIHDSHRAPSIGQARSARGH